MRRLTLLFLSIFYLILAGSIAAFSMPADRQCSFLLELKQDCVKNDVKCDIVVKGDKSKKAYSLIDGTITISTTMLNELPEEQVRSIVFHEIAHLKLEHHKIWKHYLDSGFLNAMPMLQVRELRHTQELQADRFAVLLLIQNGYEVALREALHSVIPQERRYLYTNTHPSCSERTKRIKRLEEHYESR